MGDIVGFQRKSGSGYSDIRKVKSLGDIPPVRSLNQADKKAQIEEYLQICSRGPGRNEIYGRILLVLSRINISKSAPPDSSVRDDLNINNKEKLSSPK